MGTFLGFMGAALRAKNAGLPASKAGFNALMGVYKTNGGAKGGGLNAVNSYVDRLKNPPGSNVAAVPRQQTLATGGMPSPQVGVPAILGTHTLLGQ